VVERSLRPIALNRKSALFDDSDGGAEHWAVIASLIETANSAVSSHSAHWPMSGRVYPGNAEFVRFGDVEFA
jgi:hypothetical protein